MMMNPLPKKLTHGGGGHNHNRLARKLACCSSDENSTLARASFVDRLIEEEMKSTASIRELIAEHKKKREQNFNLGHSTNTYNSNYHSNGSGECSSSPASATEDGHVTKHKHGRKRGKSKSKRSKKQSQQSQRRSHDQNHQQDQQQQRTKSSTTSKNRKRQQQPLAEHLQKSAAIGRSSLESVDDSMIPRALSIVSSSTHSPVSYGPVTNNIPVLDKTRTITKLILGHDSPMEFIQNMKSSPTITSNSPPKYENELLMEISKLRNEEPLALVREKNSILTLVVHKTPEDPEKQVKPQPTNRRRSSKSCPPTGKIEETPSSTNNNDSPKNASLPSKEDAQQAKTALSTAVAEGKSKNRTIKCLQFDPTTTHGNIYTLQKGSPVVIRKTDGTVNNTCIFTMPPEANQEEEKWIAKSSVAKDASTTTASIANRRNLLKVCNSPRNNNKTTPPTGRSPSLTKRRMRMLALPADQQPQRRNSDPEITIEKDVKHSDVQQHHVPAKPQPPRWFRS